MTKTKTFESQYRTACYADRTSVTLAGRFAAQDQMVAIVEAAIVADDGGDQDAATFLSNVLKIDEAVRLELVAAGFFNGEK